jgi:hypothetical protein
VNQGVRAAICDVLLILNPDAIAEPGAIDALLDCFTRTQAAVVGGALLDADGQPATGFTFRRLPTLASLLFEALLVNQVWPGNPVNRHYRCLDTDYSEEQQVEQPAGACLGVTRDAWNAVRGMDVAFFPVWFEDVDFCYQLRQPGAPILYCPTARFRHCGAHSVGQLDFGKKQTFWYRNMVRYATKHFSSASVVILRLGIFVGMGLRALAALFGARPPNVSAGEALRSYFGVAVWAIGLGPQSGNLRAC